MKFFRKPPEPQGNGPQEVWLRTLLAWVSQFELTSVVGGLKKANPNGGYSLVFNATSSSESKDQFRIYQGSTWLKMKVATGDLITTGDAFEPSNPDTELTLTSGVAKFYIYLSFSSATAASFIATATAPTWDVNKVPIGWVDTTDTTNSRSVIHQLQREYIYNPCL